MIISIFNKFLGNAADIADLDVHFDNHCSNE